MGIFDIFKDKNPNYLRPEEKEAAQLLQIIIKDYAEGQHNFITDKVDKLSVDLYHLAFKRTNQKVIPHYP